MAAGSQKNRRKARVILGVIGLLAVVFAGFQIPRVDTEEKETSITSQDPADLWLAAYMKMREAEREETLGNGATALRKYREAQRQFAVLQTRHSGWRNNMIKFRTKKLDEKVDSLLPFYQKWWFAIEDWFAEKVRS